MKKPNKQKEYFIIRKSLKVNQQGGPIFMQSFRSFKDII